jgi:hypothetical protein
MPSRLHKDIRGKAHAVHLSLQLIDGGGIIRIGCTHNAMREGALNHVLLLPLHRVYEKI